MILTDEEKAQEAENLKIFMEQFGDAIQVAANVYCDHRPERGDTWNTMSSTDIAGRLFEEFNEWVKERNASKALAIKQAAEAVDVVNFALMFVQSGGPLVHAYVKNGSKERAAITRSES